jgi:hypothetical protein
MYLAPGFLGGLASTVLMVDALQHTVSRSPASATFRKSPLYSFQLMGSLTGLAYFALGPMLAVRGSIGCSGEPSLPSVMNPRDAEMAESPACTVNRASIYLTMVSLNLLLVNLRATRNKLAASFKMQLAATEDGTRKLTALALLIPAALAVAMYSMDKLDPASTEFQGQIARWTVQCGPRLGLATELLLVHFPICASCAGITYFAIRTALLASNSVKAMSSSMRDVRGDAAKPPSDSERLLKELASSLVKVGALCAALGVLYSIVVLLVVPQLTQTSNEFKDYLVCRSFRATASKLKLLVTQPSCMELDLALGLGSSNSSSSDTANNSSNSPTTASRLPVFQVRPASWIVGLTVALPAVVPLCVSLFYFKFLFNRRRRKQEREVDRSARKKNSSHSSRSSSSVAPATQSKAPTTGN